MHILLMTLEHSNTNDPFLKPHDSAGYLWGGLFSSFPGTITPVLVFLHLKNGKEMSYTVIKSSPIGLSATGLYSCTRLF
jgi:hypothetical protein